MSGQQTHVDISRARRLYIRFNIVGTTFEGRQGPMSQVKTGERVYLVRDPQNMHDPWAIMVLNGDRYSLGYVPKETARSLNWFVGEPVIAVVVDAWCSTKGIFGALVQV